MLSIAILDDNIKLLEEYEQLIPAWFSKNNIKGQIVVATTDYKEFVKEVLDQTANVCIIDINLRSEVNGLYVAKLLRKEGVHTEIIFCTGLLEFMPQAFDVNAYHFIVKPVGRNLEKCLIKLNKEMETRENSKSTLEIKFGSRIYYVPMESITHIRREGSKTFINTIKGVLEVYKSLEALGIQINNENFVKCHRAIIVNRDFIKYIDKKSKSIVLTNGCKCEMGSKFISTFYHKERSSDLI